MAPYPWFDFLGLDAKYYDEWAQRILREGLQAKDLLLSTATVALAYLLARLWGGRRLAAVAAGMNAVYGPLIYYSVAILYPTVTVFLATSHLLLLYEAARRRSWGFAFAAGALLGIYALGRGNVLLFAPPAFFWLIAAWGDPVLPRLGRWRDGLAGGIALAAGTLLFILPATIHNARSGDAAFLTTNGGLNFYIGNGPMASGGHETPVLYVTRDDGTVETITADLHKDVECRTEAERVLGRSLTYTEVSSFYLAETLRFIRANPGTFLSRLVMKFTHFWSTYEVPQIEHFGYFRQFSRVLGGPTFSFGLLGPLTVIGMAFALREWRRWSLLYLFVIAYSTSVILFFVLARYRLPIVPALFPFAAYGLLEIIDAVRGGRWRRAGGAVAAAVLVAWLMQANFYGVDESKGIAQILYRHGIVADTNGDYEEAIGHYRDALALKPDYDKCHLNLGVDLARTGHPDEGMRHFQIAEQLNPDYYRAPFNRGALLDELGRFEEARAAYARSVEIEPRYLLGKVSLAEMGPARPTRPALSTGRCSSTRTGGRDSTTRSPEPGPPGGSPTSKTSTVTGSSAFRIALQRARSSGSERWPAFAEGRRPR
jgi:tetratricopeptide (TPR) repeat protein